MNLSHERVLAVSLHMTRRDERRHALPNPGAFGRSQQRLNGTLQLIRQSPEYLEIAVTDNGNLKVRPVLAPGFSYLPNGSLSVVSKCHSCENNDVIEMTIAIQVQRQRVGMPVMIAQQVVDSFRT